MNNIYLNILKAKSNNEKLLAILLDPDKINLSGLDSICDKISNSPANYIFVGGSLLSQNKTEEIITEIKKKINLPVILFPGNCTQITNNADAILFLSLISGRNPEYLIGQHIHAAPILKQLNLEVISTSYLLIDSGATTTVSYISNTHPIPANKPEITLATALAGEMLGHKLIYLEAGSGAVHPVNTNTISLVSKNISIPLIVGGGIKSLKDIEAAHKAGADLVVIGTAFENDINFFN